MNMHKCSCNNLACTDLDYEVAEKICNIDFKAVSEKDIADAVMSAFVSKHHDDAKNCWIYTFCWNKINHEIPWIPIKHIDFAYNIYLERSGTSYQNDIEAFIESYRKKVPAYSQKISLACEIAEKVNLFEHIVIVRKRQSKVWDAYLRGLEIQHAERRQTDFLEQIHLFSAESMAEIICKAALYLKETESGSTSTRNQYGDRFFTKTG